MIYISDNGLVCVFDHANDGYWFDQHRYTGIIGEIGLCASVRGGISKDGREPVV